MTTILEAGQAETNYWRDLWHYRELFCALAWRDVAVRYKQTVMGIAWALLRPALTMVVFTIVFGKLAKLPSETATPYALMVFAGMMPWTFVSTSLAECSNSLLVNTNLISKVYFPRMILPAATIIVGIIDLGVSFGLLLITMAWYKFTPSWNLLFLPVFVALAVLTSLGPGLWITALNVKYRDFRYVIPFIVQFGLYVSPVGFSSHVIPAKWRLLYSLNPMVAVIDGFRWCLLRGEPRIYWSGLAIGLLVTAAFLFVGVRAFKRTESTFADLV